MNYTVVTAKVDLQTKRKAVEIANSLGMPLSVVIKAFLEQFIRTKSVTFSGQKEIPNAYLRGVLKQAEENYKKGNTSPAFRNGKDAVKYLEDQGI